MNGEYPLTDGRGDVRLTTNAARQVTTSNTPDAFGVGSSTPGTSSAYLWNGGSGYRTENVSPLGLSYAYSLQKVGARYYDPALGCFLTRDTYLNQKPYAYCDGDPVNFSDPTGHKKKKNPLKTIVATIGAALGILTGSGTANPGQGGTGVELPPAITQPGASGSSKGSKGAGSSGGGATFSGLAGAGGLALLGYGLYVGGKWTIGVLAAPETGGGSLVLAAVLP